MENIERISDPQEFVRVAVRREISRKARGDMVFYSGYMLHLWIVGMMVIGVLQFDSVFEIPLWLSGFAVILLTSTVIWGYSVLSGRETRRFTQRYNSIREQLIDSSVVDGKI